MVFKSENHDPLVQTHFTQLIKASKWNRTPLLYFTDPRSLRFQVVKVIGSSENKIKWKLEMFSKCENLERHVQSHSTDVIQVKKKNRSPLQYFSDCRCLPFQLIKEIWGCEKKIKCKIEWFSNEETMAVLYKHTLHNYSMRTKYVESRFCIL